MYMYVYIYTIYKKNRLARTPQQWKEIHFMKNETLVNVFASENTLSHKFTQYLVI